MVRLFASGPVAAAVRAGTPAIVCAPASRLTSPIENVRSSWPPSVRQGPDDLVGPIGREDEDERAHVEPGVGLDPVQGRVGAGRRDAGVDRDLLVDGHVAVELVVGGPRAFRPDDLVRPVARGRRGEVERGALPRRVDGDEDAGRAARRCGRR